MKAQVDIVNITPKKAAEYLDNLFAGQRTVRESHVKTMADDMRSGRFRLSCDALVLVKGKLANGQHRMWAVVESDTAQQFLLMRTDDEELYKVIDGGIKRTVGDVVNLASGVQLSAVSNLVIGYERKLLTSVGYAKRVGRVENIEHIEANSEALTEAVQLAGRLTACHLNLAPKSVVGAFAYLAKKQQHGVAGEEFLNHVFSGDEPERVTGVLRERLLKFRMSTGKVPSQTILALLIKAFNLHVTGSRISKSGFRLQDGEPFPEISKPTNSN